MPPGTDMEWGALVMWAALGVIAGAVLVAAALVGLVSQLTESKAGARDRTASTAGVSGVRSDLE